METWFRRNLKNLDDTANITGLLVGTGVLDAQQNSSQVFLMATILEYRASFLEILTAANICRSSERNAL